MPNTNFNFLSDKQVDPHASLFIIWQENIY